MLRANGAEPTIICSFCNATVTGCSLTQVCSDIVGRNVVGQKKINLRLVDQYTGRMIIEMHNSKTAQQLMNRDMTTTE